MFKLKSSIVSETTAFNSIAVLSVKLGLNLNPTSNSKFVKLGSTIIGVIDTTFFPLRTAPLIVVFSSSVNVSAVLGLIHMKILLYLFG